MTLILILVLVVAVASVIRVQYVRRHRHGGWITIPPRRCR